MSDLRLHAVIKETLKAAGGSRGKLMAPAGRAFLHAYWDVEQRFYERARVSRRRAKKIVLAVGDDAALREIASRVEGVGFTLVEDAALTDFKTPTLAAIALGPIDKAELPQWLTGLRGLV